MNYNHLTIEERCCIRKYYNEGCENNRPKKVLGYKAPADLFEQELQKVLHLT